MPASLRAVQGAGFYFFHTIDNLNMEPENFISQAQLLGICRDTSSLIIAMAKNRHTMTQQDFEDVVRHAIFLSIKSNMADKKTGEDATAIIAQANALIASTQASKPENLLQRIYFRSSKIT